MRASEPLFQLYRWTGDDVVWWRLLSPNGRSLGRLASPRDDVADCLQSIVTLRAHLDELVPVLRLSPGLRWRWSLNLHDVVVVVGLGDHERRIRSIEACRKLVEVAAYAQVDPRVHSFVPRGRPEEFEGERVVSGGGWPGMRGRGVQPSI